MADIMVVPFPEFCITLDAAHKRGWQEAQAAPVHTVRLPHKTVCIVHFRNHRKSSLLGNRGVFMLQLIVSAQA